MLDIELIRKNPDIVRADLEKRKDTEKLGFLDKLLAINAVYLQKLVEIQDIRTKRNVLSRQIGDLKKASGDASLLLSESAKIPLVLEALEAEQQHRIDEINYYLKRLPNILHESVPVGADETSNVVVGEFGKKPSFTFTPKSHVDILQEFVVFIN